MCGCFWRLICRELIWINAEEHSQKLSSLTRFSCHNRFVFFSAIFIFYALERGGKRRARKSICKRCGVNDAMLEAILSLPIKWKIVFNLSPKWNFSTIYILNFLLSHLQWLQRMCGRGYKVWSGFEFTHEKCALNYLRIFTFALFSSLGRHGKTSLLFNTYS